MSTHRNTYTLYIDMIQFQANSKYISPIILYIIYCTIIAFILITIFPLLLYYLLYCILFIVLL